MSVLESARPLSESTLWHRQRDYYATRNVAAWGSGPVPYYITSNPLIARSYARMTLAYLRDQAAAGLLARDKPFYIVELGAGSARFSFHFRRALDAQLAGSEFADLDLVLVMTDLIDANLDHWRARTEFAEWFASGKMDLALFDIERDEQLHLRLSDRVLSPGWVRNPMIFIANYVFDSVPHDAFRAADGRIEEYLAVLHDNDAEGCRIEFNRRPITRDHYADPMLNHLLGSFATDQPRTVSIPVAAISCLARLRKLSSGRMLLLTGDKGYGAVPTNDQAPVVAQHGSYSMMVNFDAIGRWVRLCGGIDWHPSRPPSGLYVAAFAFGAASLATCDLEYRRMIDRSRENIEHPPAALSFDQALSFARRSGFDAAMMPYLIPAWREGLDQAGRGRREALCEAIARIDESYFPIGERYDLAFDLGVLLLRMEHYERAAEMFRKSLARYGADASCLINLALCLHRLKRPREAEVVLNEGLTLDPGNSMGLMLRRHIGWAVMICGERCL